MSDYRAPLKDMAFCLQHVAGLQDTAQMKAGELDQEMVDVILSEAGRMASETLAPLNVAGDREGCILADGDITTPEGFKDAYALYRDNGWNGVPFNPEYGGQGLPWVMAFTVQEMWQSANMGFALCPLLNQAAVEAIDYHGSQEQKDLYLEKLISGEWAGTMHLTESNAGSDVGAQWQRLTRLLNKRLKEESAD